MKNKKLLTLTIIGIMSLFSLYGCGKEGASSDGTKEELVFVNYRDIRDLNPHLYAGEMYAQEMLFETLVNITEDGYEGVIAESWDITENGKVYTFKIRDGITFSDGEVCDAYAVQANFDAILENRDRHAWLEMMQLLESAVALDANTFEIRLSKSYYPMLTELGVTRPFAMASPKAMKNGSTMNGLTEFIGTGSYVLEENITDEYAVFVANPTYWGEQPKIKKITVKVIPDSQTRILALEKGEIDFIFGVDLIDADTVKKYRDSEKFTVAMSQPMSTLHIVMNANKGKGVLEDLAVRQALQHATDRKAISEGIFYGTQAPADTLYSELIPYCDVDLEPYEYNVATANQILDDAGWKLAGDARQKDGVDLEFTLSYNSSDVAGKTVAEYLQSEYKKIGVNMEIKGHEGRAYMDYVKLGDFDMAFNYGWGMPYDPQSSLAAMRQPVYGDYEAQLGLADKEEIDAAITEILTSTDETRRQELYKYVLSRLHEEAIYLPLTYKRNIAIYVSDLKGFNFKQTLYEVSFPDLYFE